MLLLGRRLPGVLVSLCHLGGSPETVERVFLDPLRLLRKLLTAQVRYRYPCGSKTEKKSNRRTDRLEDKGADDAEGYRSCVAKKDEERRYDCASGRPTPFALHVGHEYSTIRHLQSGQSKGTAKSLGWVNSRYRSSNVSILDASPRNAAGHM
jgi:hypothetical protein